MGPAPVNKIEKGNIWYPKRSADSSIQKTMITYKGINAIGAVIGTPAILHHILLRCKSCLAVAMVRSTDGSFSDLIAFPGKSTSIFFDPCDSSRRRCALKDGILLRPHSSKGIRCWTLLPQVTRLFFHPFSTPSHFAHVSAALTVILSTRESSLGISLLSGRE